MNINIQVIPPEQMRPEVDGADWYFDANGDLQVRVCPMSDWKRETLLAIHEAVEAIMCREHGISHHVVDQWDLEFNKTHAFDVNAGDFTDCPYRREHCAASAIERVLALELNVPWQEYDLELASEYPGVKPAPVEL